MRKATDRARLRHAATALGGLAKDILDRIEDAIGSSDDVAEQTFNKHLQAQIRSVCPTVGEDIGRIWYEVRHAQKVRVVIHVETLGMKEDTITTEFAIAWDDLPDRHRRALILNKRFARVVYAPSANGGGA